VPPCIVALLKHAVHLLLDVQNAKREAAMVPALGTLVRNPGHSLLSDERTEQMVSPAQVVLLVALRPKLFFVVDVLVNLLFE